MTSRKPVESGTTSESSKSIRRMGQLIVVNDDCVTKEDLMSHISQILISRDQKKRRKISCSKNKSYKKAKIQIGLSSGKTLVTKSKSFDVCELTNLETTSPVLSSRASALSQQMSTPIDFNCVDRMVKKSRCCHIDRASSSGQDVCNCNRVNKSIRKRKRVEVIEDRDKLEKQCIQKQKNACEILKVKLKQNMSAGKRLKSESIISKQDDGNKISAVCFDKMSSALSCVSTSTTCDGEACVLLENGDLQNEGHSKFVGPEQQSTIRKAMDGRVTEISRKLKLRKKHGSEKVARKAASCTALLSECDSGIVDNDYSSAHSEEADVKSQSFSDGALKISDFDCSQSNGENESLCLGRLFDGGTTTLAEVQTTRESSQDMGKGNVVQVSSMQNIPDQMYVAVDCEMVGVGLKGKKSVLARCSIVDYDGNVVYDKYVRPSEEITDYRTPWSGIRPVHMKTAVPIHLALRDIKEHLYNKIVIGHAVYHDFKVLGYTPDHVFVRDTAQCHRLVEMAELQGRGNGLKKLSEALLDRKIQDSRHGHCSVEDATATLDLFKLVRHSWEPELYLKWLKKDSNVSHKIAHFVNRSSSNSVSEDFLNDKFWPSHVLD